MVVPESVDDESPPAVEELTPEEPEVAVADERARVVVAPLWAAPVPVADAVPRAGTSYSVLPIR